MLYTRDNFPEISSESNQFWTWVIRIVFALLIGMLILSFFCIPILLYFEKEIYGLGAVFFLIIYYPILCVVLKLLIKLVIRYKKKAVHTIIVNNEGAFFKKHDGSTESILYKYFQHSKTNYLYDIFTRSVPVDGHNLIYLKVYYGGEEITVDFGRIDVAFGFYAQNHRMLRSHFLNGIKLFRPDLVIDPIIYQHFFINPETFEFDKKSHRSVILFTVIFIILLFVGTYLGLHYR